MTSRDITYRGAACDHYTFPVDVFCFVTCRPICSIKRRRTPVLQQRRPDDQTRSGSALYTNCNDNQLACNPASV